MAADSPAPLGTVGEYRVATASETVSSYSCRCGAPVHASKPGRCAAGHPLKGNQLALVTGEHSRAFWSAAEEQRQELRRGFLRDRGVTEADAPIALLEAADGAAQALLIRNSAFLRLVESGGPTTLHDRRRTALDVWERASDRALKHLQVIGLERASKHVDVAVALSQGNR